MRSTHVVFMALAILATCLISIQALSTPNSPSELYNYFSNLGMEDVQELFNPRSLSATRRAMVTAARYWAEDVISQADPKDVQLRQGASNDDKHAYFRFFPDYLGKASIKRNNALTFSTNCLSSVTVNVTGTGGMCVDWLYRSYVVCPLSSLFH